MEPLALLPAALAVTLLLALPPWLAYVLPSALPGGDANWYTAHRHGQMSTPIDALVVLLKFHPVCYLHVFVFGMVLARWRDLLKLERRARPRLFVSACAGCCNVGATAGYAALLVVFLAPPLRLGARLRRVARLRLRIERRFRRTLRRLAITRFDRLWLYAAAYACSRAQPLLRRLFITADTADTTFTLCTEVSTAGTISGCTGAASLGTQATQASSGSTTAKT